MNPCSHCGRPTGVNEEGPLFRDDGWLSSLAFIERLDEPLVRLRRRRLDLCDRCFADRMGPKTGKIQRCFKFRGQPYSVSDVPRILQMQITEGWTLPLQALAAQRDTHEVPGLYMPFRALPFQVSMSLNGRFHWSSMTQKTLPVPLYFEPKERLWSLYQPAPNYWPVMKDPMRRPNPWFWRGLQAEVGVWLSGYSIARELLADTPVLLWLLLAPPIGIPEFSHAEIKRLLSRSRRVILREVFAAKRLGLNAEPKISLSFLRKLRPQDWSASEAEEIFRAIRAPRVIEALRHQPIITPLDLWATRSYPLLRDHGLSELLVGHLHEDGPLAYQLRVATRWAQDTLEAAAALGLDHQSVTRALSDVDTLRDLWDYRSRWRTRAGLSVDDAVIKARSFSVPLKGTKSIIPLTTAEELQQEGRQMAHCVGSYAERVQKGRCFIYKVLRPSRATLCIARDERGLWHLESLKGHRNAEVTPSTTVHVVRWLGEKQRLGAPAPGEDNIIPIRGHATPEMRSMTRNITQGLRERETAAAEDAPVWPPAPVVGTPLERNMTTVLTQVEWNALRSDGGAPVTKVVGVGFAGGAIADHLIDQGVQAERFIAINTCWRDLRSCRVPYKLTIGPEITRGLGSGSLPTRGFAAAMESRAEISEHLAGADVVILLAGLGRGTGTGSSPVVARLARQHHAFTIAVVSTPFHFEGNRPQATSHEGMRALYEHVDCLIAIDNEGFVENSGPGVSLLDIYRRSNDAFYRAVYAMVSFIRDGDVSARDDDLALTALQMARLRRKRGAFHRNDEPPTTTQARGHLCAFGHGQMRGADRALKATRRALKSRLLNAASVHQAKEILLHVSTGHDGTLAEVQESVELIQSEVGSEVPLFFDHVIDPRFSGEFHVTLMLTGLDLPLNQPPQEVAL